jgi:putative ABC transport system substrate-binding protein
MNRRRAIALLGSAAVFAPLAARTQQVMPVVGFLHQGTSNSQRHTVADFHSGLKAAGFVEGRNITIEYRWAEGRYDRLPAMAADLVRRQVTVIMAALLPAASAAKGATATIPIVFLIGSDPVQVGLVSNFTRPGGNITGFTRLTVELGPKRLEILRELVPTAKVIAFLVNTTNPNAAGITRDARAAATKLGLQLRVVNATTSQEIDTAFVDLARFRPDGLLVGGDSFFFSQGERMASLAARHAIPAIYSSKGLVDAGGLMSYGARTDESDHLAGIYVGRILKGEKPGDLPVQQAAKVEFVVNLKVARALGITVPLSLLGRADEVIE